jgi:hypothetical protein
MRKLSDSLIYKRSDGLLVPLSTATVTVYAAGTSNLATLYSTNGTGSPLANPFTVDDAEGDLDFYAPAGRYDVRIVSGGTTRWVRDVLFFDPDEITAVLTHKPTGISQFLRKISTDGMSGTTMAYADFNETMATVVGQNAASGLTPADNIVYKIGWNINAGGTREDVTKACMQLSLERSFALNGVGPMVFEWHWEGVTVGGTSVRPFGMVSAHDGSIMNGTFAVDTFTIQGNATDATQNGRSVIFNMDGGVVTVNGVPILKAENDQPFLKQFNAAGNSQLNHAYYTADNSYLIPAAVSFSGAFQALTQLGGNRGAIAQQYSGAQAGSRCRYFLSTTAVTGDMIGDEMVATASGVLRTTLQNAGAGSARQNVLGSAASGYEVNDVKVVGAQGAAIADVAAAAGAPTQAEFNALVTAFNALLARQRAHGLIAT